MFPATHLIKLYGILFVCLSVPLEYYIDVKHVHNQQQQNTTAARPLFKFIQNDTLTTTRAKNHSQQNEVRRKEVRQ